MYENEDSSCALPHQIDNWHSIVWRQVIHVVNRLQRRIAKAVKDGRWGKAKALMYLISKSFYAKLLAVFRVTTNKGGIVSPTIMNMVLDGMETALKKQFPRWKGQKVNFIRYADDFNSQRKSLKSLISMMASTFYLRISESTRVNWLFVLPKNPSNPLKIR